MGQGIISHINEKEFQSLVVTTARENNWLVYHTFDSRKSSPGFPDLCLVRNGVIMFVELKTDKGAVTTGQRQWIEQLLRHQYHCQRFLMEIWRPHIWEKKKKLLTDGVEICYHKSVSIKGEYAVCDECGHTMKAW